MIWVRSYDLMEDGVGYVIISPIFRDVLFLMMVIAVPPLTTITKGFASTQDNSLLHPGPAARAPGSPEPQKAIVCPASQSLASKGKTKQKGQRSSSKQAPQWRHRGVAGCPQPPALGTFVLKSITIAVLQAACFLTQGPPLWGLRPAGMRALYSEL
ncbi:hypothetical protein JEQ12_015068 [Ovis aries]|uniref:Uncharacterized protein n=1 Tax=Ovis aries TaxID=9940 RepID=A0A836AI41_SHEEP|nr:hypothetical protein JEQ12_015068 [Ovis aries]